MCRSSMIFYIKLIFLVIEVVGALLYFFGDNILYIVLKYGEALGCDQQCVESYRAAAIITLGLALMVFLLVPPCLQKIMQLCDFPLTTRGIQHRI